MERPSPRLVLILLWVGLPVLLYGLSSARGSMIERWEERPPTEVEETDCRIEAMMSGDNAVEVERTDRACLEAVNEAFVRPRVRRITLLFFLLGAAYTAVAGVATYRFRET